MFVGQEADRLLSGLNLSAQKMGEERREQQAWKVISQFDFL
jgi:hypothetical protein